MNRKSSEPWTFTPPSNYSTPKILTQDENDSRGNDQLYYFARRVFMALMNSELFTGLETSVTYIYNWPLQPFSQLYCLVSRPLMLYALILYMSGKGGAEPTV